MSFLHGVNCLTHKPERMETLAVVYSQWAVTAIMAIRRTAQSAARQIVAKR